MAISTKRVYIDTASLPSSKIPTGHTVPTTSSAIGTPTITEVVEFSITSSDVVNATKATAFNTLLSTELVAAIDARIAAGTGGWGINTTTFTVDYNAKVTNITINKDDPSDMYLPAANNSFVVTAEVTIVVTT